MSWRVVVAAVAIAGVLLVSAPAGSALTTPAAPGSGAGPSLQTDAVPLPAGVPSSPLGENASIVAGFTLAWPDPVGLQAYLGAVEDPSGPEYRHFLSYSEFVDRFAPGESTVLASEAILQENGARSVSVSPDRLTITASFPAAALEQMLGVHFETFGWRGTEPVYTAVGAASLPSGLRGVVAGISGLSDVTSMRPDLAARSVAPVPAGSPAEFIYDTQTATDYYLGSDYAQAYQAVDLWPGSATVGNATFPTHMAVATLLAGSYNSTYGVDLSPWDPAVLDAYFNDTFPATWPHPVLRGVPVAISGAPTPPAPGSLGALMDSTGDEFENSLDLEMAGSMAPGATVANFYFDASLLAGNPSLGDLAEYFATDLSRALSYNYSPANLSVVSGSFGISDLDDPAWDAQLIVAAGTGVTVVIASGDDGNAPNSYHPDRPFGAGPTWPGTSATNTSGAVAVGGVTLTLAGAPSGDYNGSSLNASYDTHIGTVNGNAFTSMTAWYDLAGSSAVGTEGGVSTVYAEPWWQFDSAAQPAIVNATVLAGDSSLGRAEPDVAMPANNTIAYVFANATGAIYFTVLEGTSIAAPVFAGLLADLVAVDSLRAGAFAGFGFLDPELYRIASFYAANPSPTTTPFLDVTEGANYEYSAGPGWDATTGWGGVLAPRLLLAEQNLTIRDFVYRGPTPGLPAKSSSAGIPWTTVELILGVGVAAALAAVLFFARPRRHRVPPSVPSGAVRGGGTSGAPSFTTFSCPYCGAERPSEPVRCPSCGML